jgi:predicted DCC family thiol-disulfide oxidoreductase YuxK
MTTSRTLNLSAHEPDIPALHHGCIYYDGACRFCTGWIASWKQTLARHGFTVAPLQEPGAQQKLNLSDDELLRDLRMLTAKGEVLSGANVYLYVMRRVWWALPLFALFSLPVFNAIFHFGYRRVANNRYCIAGQCEVRRSHGVFRFLPLIILTPLAYIVTIQFAAWIQMWTLVVGMIAGFKFQTWWPERRRFHDAKLTFIYVFLWPGMDPQPFLKRGQKVPIPPTVFAKSLLSIAVGAATLYVLIPLLVEADPLFIGWAGMFGLLCVLHFGALKIWAISWQRAGIAVKPVMQAPVLAHSVSDFWGARWNTAFRDLAHREIFLPLQTRFGTSGAMLAVFAVSGLVHDLVISVPARAGYGLPTLYFILQALAVLLERSGLGRRCGLQRGWCGRFFTYAVVLVPVPLLFHRPFAEAVMIPFLRAIGSI